MGSSTGRKRNKIEQLLKVEGKGKDMPRDQRKYQKALMKKRSKQKVASQHKSHQQEFGPLSGQAIIRRSRTFPLFECLISNNWQKDDLGLVEILLARKQPDGDISFGSYLVDTYCLGLKSTFANAGFSLARYENEVRGRVFHETVPVECPIELAPRGELEEPYHLTFGKNGKPFFIQGPHDNPALILRQLEKTAGPGNYDYLAMLDAF